jgi:superkiller protein 3
LKISCPNCSASYELDDARVPAAGLSIKCPRCKGPFTVHKSADGKPNIKAAGAPAAPANAAVPLPGMGKPADRPITKPVAPARPGAGAVPLPGSGDVLPPIPPPAARPGARQMSPSGAVPLPGLDGASPQRPARAPLPPAGVDLALEVTSQDVELTTDEPVQRSGAVPLPGLDDSFGSGALPMPPMTAARPPPPPRIVEGDANDPFANIELGTDDPPPSPAKEPAPQAHSDDDFSLAPSTPDSGAASVDLPADDGLSLDLPPPAKKAAPKSGAADMDLLDFVDEAPKKPEAPKAAPGRRPPPPMLSKAPASAEPTLDIDPRPDLAQLPLDDDAAADAEPKKADKERKKREREEKAAAREREEKARRKAQRANASFEVSEKKGLSAIIRPRYVAVAAGLLVVAGVVAMGVRAGQTSAGLFWMNRVLPGKRAATLAEAKVIEQGLVRLGQANFVDAREAVAAGAQLLSVLSEDEEVKAFFVLAASELKIEYGQTGADWDQAKRVMEKMKGSSAAQNRARAAFALASGDPARCKQLLAGTGDQPNADIESIALFAGALLNSGEAQRAATILDAALKTRPDAPKLLLLRGVTAVSRGQLPEAAGFYDRVLKQSPENGRALVELAAVRVAQKDPKAAEEILAKALDSTAVPGKHEDLRKSLDAAQEARANMLRGNIAAAAHDPKAAEAAYERGVVLDPTSGALREAYGNFRLSRREWEKAGKQFEAAIAAGDTSGEALSGAATACLMTSRLLEADKYANQAAAKDGSNAHYIYLQGRVAEAIGKGDEAFKKYEAALAKKPTSAEALAAEGQMLIARNDKAKAKDKLNAALAIPEADRTGSEDRAAGDLALALGEKSSAQALFSAALAIDPEDPLAHAGQGKSLSAQGDLAGAKKELEIAIAQVDTDASMYYEYGSVLRRMGQSDAALEALGKAVKLDGKESRYRARLGALLVDRGQYADAEKELRQAVLMDPRGAEGQYFLGRALIGKKELTEAVDVLKKAVNIEPDNAEFYYWLGIAYENGQQVPDALEALQKSIQKDAKSADALEHLGRNLMVENRFADAVDAFKRAAQLDSKRARLWAEVGDAEQQSGDLDGAIRDFQRALAQDGKLPGVWTKLGVAYKDKDCKGCRSRAEDALQRAVQVDPNDAAAHHELGYMYKDDGKRKAAIVEFQRYLDLKPDAGDLATVQDDIYYLKEESRRAP